MTWRDTVEAQAARRAMGRDTAGGWRVAPADLAAAAAVLAAWAGTAALMVGLWGGPA